MAISGRPKQRKKISRICFSFLVFFFLVFVCLKLVKLRKKICTNMFRQQYVLFIKNFSLNCPFSWLVVMFFIIMMEIVLLCRLVEYFGFFFRCGQDIVCMCVDQKDKSDTMLLPFFWKRMCYKDTIACVNCWFPMRISILEAKRQQQFFLFFFFLFL